MRKFVLSIAVAAFLSGCVGVKDITRIVDDARVTARLGVMANTEVGWITETKMLEKALRFYRQSKVDAVVITGHVTRFGYKNQYEVLETVWRKVFGGTDVRLIVQDGRYEVKGFPFAVSAAKPMGTCEVLTFFGEWKLPLTDEICFYPRTANRVCAGSMSGFEVQGGFERAEELARAAQASAQGLLVSVYSDRTRIRRLDFTAKEPLDPGVAAEFRKKGFVYAEDVAEPWTIGPEEDSPPPPPEFWADTRLLVLPGMDGDGRICTLRWPSVQRRFTGARARSYEVTAAFADDPQRVFARKSVLSDGFYRSEERDVDGGTCVFRAGELVERGEDGSRLVFAVTPIGAFGKRGTPIVSDPIPWSP